MSVFGAMDISASGLTAQTLRRDIISQNIANAQTTRDADGNVYKKKDVVFAEKSQVTSTFGDVFGITTGTKSAGVKVTEIVEDQSGGARVYDPTHPDADEEGYVTYPNVNIVTEMTDLIDASRAYEANITAFNATKSMIMKALEIGK